MSDTLACRTWQIPHSGRNIPNRNHVMHEAHCSRLNIQQIQRCPKCGMMVPNAEMSDHNLAHSFQEGGDDAYNSEVDILQQYQILERIQRRQLSRNNNPDPTPNNEAQNSQNQNRMQLRPRKQAASPRTRSLYGMEEAKHSSQQLINSNLYQDLHQASSNQGVQSRPQQRHRSQQRNSKSNIKRAINRLPVYPYQRQGDLENCMVCQFALEDGNNVKLLPCLHKYHDECIDSWLRRKPECPICKLSLV